MTSKSNEGIGRSLTKTKSKNVKDEREGKKEKKEKPSKENPLTRRKTRKNGRRPIYFVHPPYGNIIAGDDDDPDHDDEMQMVEQSSRW